MDCILLDSTTTLLVLCKTKLLDSLKYVYIFIIINAVANFNIVGLNGQLEQRSIV